MDEGETIEKAAIRELYEEVRVSVEGRDLRSAGSATFYFEGRPDWDNHMFIFVVQNWKGEPQESDEMKPRWFGFHEIPYASMWVDDAHWLPHVLRGEKIQAEFHFNQTGDIIERFEIRQES